MRRITSRFCAMALTLLIAALPSARAGEHVITRSEAEVVAVVSDDAPVMLDNEVLTTVEKGRWFGVVNRRGEWVGIQVSVGDDLRHGWIGRRHVKVLTDADVNLAAEALKLAKRLNPKLDIVKYRARLDALVNRVAAAAVTAKSPREKARAIAVQLFQREGFTSSKPLQTLDSVVDQKKGNCWNSSLLYLCIAEKLKMPLYLVLTPGHAFVRYDDGRIRFNIETTQNGALYEGLDHLKHLAEAHGTEVKAFSKAETVGVLHAVPAVQLRNGGKLTRTWEMLTTALEINPRHAHAYIHRGIAYSDRGEYDRAIRDYDRAIKLRPDDVTVYINRGAAFWKKGAYDRAIRDFDEAIKLRTDDATVYINRGAAYWKKGEHDRAIRDLDKAIKLKPSDANAYYYRGNAYNDNGEYGRAIRDFGRAIKLRPNDADAYMDRGTAYDAKGEHDRAIRDFDEAIKLRPDYSTAYYNRGNAYNDNGEYGHAIRDFDKAIKLRPDYATAYCARGVAYYAKGEYDHAIRDFGKALALRSDYADANCARGVVYQARGEYDRAIRDFDKAIKLNPNSAEAHNNRGGAYTAKGEYDRAIRDFDKAIQLKPRLAEAHQNRGVAYLGKGEYDRVIRDCDKVIQLGLDLAETYHSRAVAYFYKRDYDKAWADVKTCQERGGQLPPAFLEALKKASSGSRETQPAPLPIDPQAYTQLGSALGIDVLPLQRPPKSLRGGVAPAVQLLYPAKDVRIQGLGGYYIAVGEDYEGDGFLEFRNGSKVLHRVPFEPAELFTVGSIPLSVLDELKPGSTVTWGIFFERKRKQSVTQTIKIVNGRQAEDRLKRLRGHALYRQQHQLVRVLLEVEVLIGAQLYAEALERLLELKATDPTKPESRPMSRRVLSITLHVLERLDLTASDLYHTVASVYADLAK